MDERIWKSVALGAAVTLLNFKGKICLRMKYTFRRKRSEVERERKKLPHDQIVGTLGQSDQDVVFFSLRIFPWFSKKKILFILKTDFSYNTGNIKSPTCFKKKRKEAVKFSHLKSSR